MTRQRKLKVYVSSTYVGPETMEALGAADAQMNNRGVNAFVAARSLKEAAVLMGTKVGSSTTLGGASVYWGKDDEVTEMTMAKPGQVFLTKHMRDREEQTYLEVAVSLNSTRRLTVGAQSDLALGEALLAQKESDKAEAKAKELERIQERDARAEHRKQTSRSINEALERLTPLLETLGINPQTVVMGEGVGMSNRSQLGVLMPAEAVEQLVRKAIEFEEMMES